MKSNDKDIIKFEKYKELIDKHFGDNFDKYWNTFLMIWLLENVDKKCIEDIENIIIKTKNIVDESEVNRLC